MQRAIAVTLAGLVAFLVLLDPYTFHKTASDLIQPAPAWQLALGLADVALLAAVGTLALLRRTVAFDLLAGEIVFALVVAILLVSRDGVARFIHGWSAEEYMSFYLGSIALRVVLLWLLRPRGAVFVRRLSNER
jgi:hypothetical protein